MIVLPVVARELRVAARRRNTYWLRVVLAAVALGILGWVLLVARTLRFFEPGPAAFSGIAAFVFLYCWLAGLRATADCLSEEKREGTMGLLFLTDLKGYDVVLGKLAATSLHVVSGLLAVLPVVAVPLLMGGVTAGEVGRVALAALDILFLSLAAGLLASAVSREEWRALGLCFLLLLVQTLGLPALGALLADRLDQAEPHPLFFLTSPLMLGLTALDASAAPARWPAFFPMSAAVVHGVAWLYLVLACLIVPRTWQEKAANPRPTRWRVWWQRLRLESPAQRLRFRRRLLDANPFSWLAARERWDSVRLWVFLAISAGLWCWGWASYPRDWLYEPVLVLTALTLNSILKVWVADRAARQFVTDRASGALELLLVTPLKVREIVRGQLAALRRQFGLPVALVVGVELLFLAAYADAGDWALTWTAGLLMLLADLLTLSWLGMWLGLTQRSLGRALAGALGLVCVLPWVLYGGLLTASSLLGPSNWFPAIRGLHEEDLIVIWLVLGLAVDLACGLWARHRLLTRFRPVVAERFVRPRARQ